jgi:ribonuclease HI
LSIKIIINVDGASRGNPGPAAIGIVLKNEKAQLLSSISDSIGITTNNQAEYQALIAGLKKAISMGAREVEVRSDSELIVRQMLGIYRVKEQQLIPLHQEARRLAGSLASFKIISVSREENREADKLANMALNKLEKVN